MYYTIYSYYLIQDVFSAYSSLRLAARVILCYFARLLYAFVFEISNNFRRPVGCIIVPAPRNVWSYSSWIDDNNW